MEIKMQNSNIDIKYTPWSYTTLYTLVYVLWVSYKKSLQKLILILTKT